MPHLSDIGPQLVDARVARGMTQRELAELLGIHQQQVARWERDGYGCVSLTRLSRVADALGVTGWSEGVSRPASLLAAEEGASYGAPAALAEPAAPATPVRDLGEVIARVRDAIPELQERFGVTRIAVFGSFARGQQRPDSDVDLIVEVAEPTMSNVFGAERALGDLLGRPTETGSLSSVNPRVRPGIEEDLVDVWKA